MFSKTSSNWPFLASLMNFQNVNVARFARNVEWDFFCDFQPPWTRWRFPTGLFWRYLKNCIKSVEKSWLFHSLNRGLRFVTLERTSQNSRFLFELDSNFFFCILDKIWWVRHLPLPLHIKVSMSLILNDTIFRG